MPLQRKTKVKFVCGTLLVLFAGLVVWQNKAFFVATQSLTLDLGFYKYETPGLANWSFFLTFFLLGVLIVFFYGLLRHFKDAKTIKLLTAKEASLVDTVARLEARLGIQHTDQGPAKSPEDWQTPAVGPTFASTRNTPVVDLPAEVK